MTDIIEIIQGHGYRRAQATESGGIIYRQKQHPRGWTWLLWIITAILGAIMIGRALYLGRTGDLGLAGAATLLSAFFAWNNYRRFTRPFQVVLHMEPEGLTLTDRKESLFFPAEEIKEFPLLEEDGTAMLFVALANQNVKPMLFRFTTGNASADLHQVKAYFTELLEKAE